MTVQSRSYFICSVLVCESFNANAVLHPTVPVHLYIFGKSDTGSFDTEVNCSC